jgi:hypothetical protein
MSLKDLLPLKPGVGSGERPRWVVAELPERPSAVQLWISAPHTVDLKYTPQRSRARDVGKMQARKFGDLLARGVRPGEAAHMMHTSIRALMDKKETRDVVRNMIEEYTLDGKVRALLQRALVNKGLLENSLPQGDPKLLLEYLKMTADDSEVGIRGAPQINATFVMDPALRDILDRTIPLPEIVIAPEEPAKIEPPKDPDGL